MKFKSRKEVSKKQLLQNEEKLRNLAGIAWSKALEEYFFPPLSIPNFKFDYTRIEGFYIDISEQWQITMNLAQAPLFIENDDYVRYFFVNAMHEIGHYDLIPYDGLINARLLSAAMKSVANIFAPIVVNFFADLIIDTKLHQKYPEDMLWEAQHTFNGIISKKKKLAHFAELIFRCYELLWNQKIDEKYDFKEVNDTAKRITKIINKNFEDDSKWEEKTRKIAAILKPIVNDTFTLIGIGANPCTEGSTRRFSDDGKGNIIEMPEEIVQIMGNPLENRNSDKIKSNNKDAKNKKAEDFAKEKSLNEFGSPAVQAGILKDGEVLNTWYRGLAKDLISIKLYEKKPSGLMPAYPETWRIGDSLEELDVVQSLLNYPKLIPNITTKKWVSIEGPGIMQEKQLPDLMIVLDSSGSMNWSYSKRISKNSKSPYHIALVAAFAVLHYVAKKGCKFSIINFSGRADICDWTFDYIKAEKRLLKYQGSGTVLPIKSMKILAEKAEKNILIILITDFGLYNWKPARKGMLELLNKGHKIVGFFISPSIRQDEDKRFKELYDKGAIFYQISNISDLINLVIKEVKKNY